MHDEWIEVDDKRLADATLVRPKKAPESGGIAAAGQQQQQSSRQQQQQPLPSAGKKASRKRKKAAYQAGSNEYVTQADDERFSQIARTVGVPVERLIEANLDKFPGHTLRPYTKLRKHTVLVLTRPATTTAAATAAGRGATDARAAVRDDSADAADDAMSDISDCECEDSVVSGSTVRCDTCDAKRWLCCVGLSRVPKRKWVCAGCKPLRHAAPAKASGRKSAKKPAAPGASATGHQRQTPPPHRGQQRTAHATGVGSSADDFGNEDYDEHTPMVQYEADENEQPVNIARAHKITVKRLIQVNKELYPGLQVRAPLCSLPASPGAGADAGQGSFA